MKKVRILLVEDDKDIVYVVAENLRKLIPELTIVSAFNLSSATLLVSSLENGEIDMIIWGGKMDKAGNTAADNGLIARAKSKFSTTPMVSMSGCDAVNTDQLHAGCTDVLMKPFKKEELIGLLRKYKFIE